MRFATTTTLSQRKHADLLVVPFWEQNKPLPAIDLGALKTSLSLPLSVGDFQGKKGEVLIVYANTKHEKRVALLGLGKKSEVTTETFRQSYAAVAKACPGKKVKTLNVPLPSSPLDHAEVVRGAVEGLLLANYTFDQLKQDTVKSNPTVLLTQATLIANDKVTSRIAKKYATIAQGVYLARDLVNGNADDVTPQYLARVARGLGRKFAKLKTTVFDKKRIEKEKMELLLAVNRGSSRDPAFIIMEYRGNPKSKDHTVVVGKGIAYDTGGLDLKTSSGMLTMKSDMGGAAAVLGTMQAAAALGLKVNLTGVIPTTENSIGSKSYKLGDVYPSYAGKTVEIISTDAEGRLVLADALAYASKKLKPTRMIDLATLTGAIVIALGSDLIGLMSNDDKLAKAIETAGEASHERLWRLPLYEEFKEPLTSDVADLKNVGTREGSAITAGKFLEQFVDGVPWAHCDIAGGAFHSKARPYHPKNGTGLGVRLLIEFLDQLK